MGNDGGSRVVFIAFTQPVGDTYVILFYVDVELLGSSYYQFIGVLMLRLGQALDLKTFPSAILFGTVDGCLKWSSSVLEQFFGVPCYQTEV